MSWEIQNYKLCMKMLIILYFNKINKRNKINKISTWSFKKQIL